MQLAKFTAQLRRPRPLRSGVIAEMFVRNGEDADAAMQLGRSDLMMGSRSMCLASKLVFQI